MVPQADTVLTFATLRHQELQAESDRARPAARAFIAQVEQPRSVGSVRSQLGALLIAIGTRLRTVSRTRQTAVVP